MKRIRATAVISAITGLAAVALLPSGAWAQAAGSQTAQNNADTSQQAQSAGVLQEVVVTAEKRATDIQTTPISMTAVTGNALEGQNEKSIIDLQTTQPGLQVSNIGNLYAAPNIRGIGNDQFSAAETPGVAVMRDGLLMQGIHDTGDPFYDMSDVEILRGPQGDFVGFSSTGGAIELNSVNPNFNGNSGYIEMQVGNYSDKKIDGAVNLPVSDTFAMRLAFNEETMGSFYRDIGGLNNPGVLSGNGVSPIEDPGATDNKNARFSVLWKPTDNFQALLKIEYNSTNPGAIGGEPNQQTFNLPAAAISEGCPDGAVAGGVAPAGPGGTCHSAYYPFSTHIPFVLNYGYTLASNASTAQERLPALSEPFWDYRDGLQLSYMLPNGIQVKSITGFQQGQWDDLSLSCACDDPSSGVGYEYVPKDDYYSQELDVLSPSTGKFTWIGGATWFARWSGVDDLGITSTPPYSLTAPEVIQTNDLTVNRMAAVFGRVSWQFTPTLQLQVGARENWDNDYVRGPLEEIELPTLAPSTCTEKAPLLPGYGCIEPPLNGAFQDKVPTGKVTLNWNPAQGQFFYLFYARGYTPGNFLPGTSEPVQPEHVGDYELGWKTTQLGGHLQGSLGGYWMIYQNMQQSVYDTATGTAGVTANIGSSQLRGIETAWNLREAGFGAALQASYEKSTLGAITTAASYALPPASSNKPQCTGPGRDTTGTGQTTCFDYTPYLLSLSGEPNPFAPEFSAGLTLDYQIPLGGGTLDPKLQFTYTSKQYGSIFDIPYYQLSPRHLLNAYITYDNGPWDVEAFMTNATNQVYINGNFGGADVYYGNPMQLGLRLRYDF